MLQQYWNSKVQFFHCRSYQSDPYFKSLITKISSILMMYTTYGILVYVLGTTEVGWK